MCIYILYAFIRFTISIHLVSSRFLLYFDLIWIYGFKNFFKVLYTNIYLMRIKNPTKWMYRFLLKRYILCAYHHQIFHSFLFYQRTFFLLLAYFFLLMLLLFISRTMLPFFWLDLFNSLGNSMEFVYCLYMFEGGQWCSSTSTHKLAFIRLDDDWLEID